MSGTDGGESRQDAVQKAAVAARQAARQAVVQRKIQLASEAQVAPAPTDDPSRSVPLLHCAHVYQRYPSPKGGFQVVLNDVNLLIPKHDFVSVVGPSGCGKSTLLRLVLGSEMPWKGELKARAKRIDHPDRDRGIVFQRYSLFPHLTVLDNVVFGLELDGTWLLQKWLTWPVYRSTHHKRYVEQAMSYLRAVGLDEHANKYPHQLSGGMQQRVAIAQAMVMKPHFLLMDEPFGALDPGTRESLQITIIETFQQQQITLFFVTHDMEEALFVGNRLVVLSPYYEPDDPSETGAKIVMDVPTPKDTRTSVKSTAEFQELIAEVRRCGFDPAVRQRVSQFDLRAAEAANQGR
ncbi:MAG: ABC transporter ATP-binding protein [Polyangiaceae bacterium]|nr:ABC transporter ATP-binding protein [Polyangiaceae bacterium]